MGRRGAPDEACMQPRGVRCAVSARSHILYNKRHLERAVWHTRARPGTRALQCTHIQNPTVATFPPLPPGPFRHAPLHTQAGGAVQARGAADGGEQRAVRATGAGAGGECRPAQRAAGGRGRGEVRAGADVGVWVCVSGGWHGMGAAREGRVASHAALGVRTGLSLTVEHAQCEIMQAHTLYPCSHSPLCCNALPACCRPGLHGDFGAALNPLRAFVCVCACVCAYAGSRRRLPPP